MIKDSGNRKEFDTGAVRDIHEGKGRCDLLPLDVVGTMFNGHSCEVLLAMAAFQKDGKTRHLIGVLNGFLNMPNCPFSSFADAILEVAKHFEEGCNKYGERNWEKGIPIHCYVDSAVRHYLKWLRGDKDEPHHRAFVWNILCCIWTCQNKPELNEYARGKGTDTCVSCGVEIPEGRQICPTCEKGGETDA